MGYVEPGFIDAPVAEYENVDVDRDAYPDRGPGPEDDRGPDR